MAGQGNDRQALKKLAFELDHVAQGADPDRARVAQSLLERLDLEETNQKQIRNWLEISPDARAYAARAAIDEMTRKYGTFVEGDDLVALVAGLKDLTWTEDWPGSVDSISRFFSGDELRTNELLGLYAEELFNVAEIDLSGGPSGARLAEKADSGKWMVDGGQTSLSTIQNPLSATTGSSLAGLRLVL